MIEEIQTYISP